MSQKIPLNHKASRRIINLRLLFLITPFFNSALANPLKNYPSEKIKKTPQKAQKAQKAQKDFQENNTCLVDGWFLASSEN